MSAIVAIAEKIRSEQQQEAGEQKKKKAKRITLQVEKYYVRLGMLWAGNSFTKTLGTLIDLADSENLRKIKNTWPELWESYLERGKKFQARMDTMTMGVEE